jgi:hypothetical protein
MADDLQLRQPAIGQLHDLNPDIDHPSMEDRPALLESGFRHASPPGLEACFRDH